MKRLYSAPAIIMALCMMAATVVLGDPDTLLDYFRLIALGACAFCAFCAVWIASHTCPHVKKLPHVALAILFTGADLESYRLIEDGDGLHYGTTPFFIAACVVYTFYAFSSYEKYGSHCAK